MCNCITENTTLLQQKMVDETKDVFIWNSKGEFYHRAFSLNGGPTVIQMPFMATYFRKKADGSPEKRERHLTLYVVPTYCPFCGEKYETI